MKRAGALAVFALALALSVVANVSAQPLEEGVPTYDHAKVMAIYKTYLKSELPSLVQSTIWDLVECKSYFPDRDYSQVVDALDRLAREDRDSSISYKAHLASMYLTYGSRLENGAAFNLEVPETAFKMVSEQLEKKFLFSETTQ